MTRSEITNVLAKGISVKRVNELPADADERELVGNISNKDPNDVLALDEDHLKMYIGKKAINNLGCYGCHDIPGFETAKPIGTAAKRLGQERPRPARVRGRRCLRQRAFQHRRARATTRRTTRSHPTSGR